MALMANSQPFQTSHVESKQTTSSTRFQKLLMQQNTPNRFVPKLVRVSLNGSDIQWLGQCVPALFQTDCQYLLKSKKPKITCYINTNNCTLDTNQVDTTKIQRDASSDHHKLALSAGSLLCVCNDSRSDSWRLLLSFGPLVLFHVVLF